MSTSKPLPEKARNELSQLYSAEERMVLNLRALLNLIHAADVDQDLKDAAYYYYLNCLREL